MQIFIMRFFLYATKLQWETMFFFFNGKKTCNLIFKLRLYFFSLYVKTKQYKKKNCLFLQHNTTYERPWLLKLKINIKTYVYILIN